ncbi:hypothetical protein [Streptomyces sp. NPDC055094]
MLVRGGLPGGARAALGRRGDSAHRDRIDLDEDAGLGEALDTDRDLPRRPPAARRALNHDRRRTPPASTPASRG